jgi:murein DD-endopeptidase MepM/ murein hydrolase activator NlpD
MINNDRYYVKIVPEAGETVHRFHVRRRHLLAALAVFAIVLLGSLGFAYAEIAHARAKFAEQQAALRRIDTQTAQLRAQLEHVKKQNTEIRQLIGAPAPAHVQRTSWIHGTSIRDVSENVTALRAESLAVAHETEIMQRLAMHLVNVRHIRELARARMLAAIPSIDPVAGAPVIGCYCYRTYPDVELSADYGDVVRAAAAGTIVANSYDGGYGIKIDIDHGNGYHTWYAHLERVDVAVGQHVYKGEPIGAVGATGFATGPHLHYQIMYDGSPVNPTPFLDGVPSNVLATLP